MLKQQMLKSQSKAKLYSRRYGTYCFTVDVLYPTVDESKMVFCNTVLMFSFQVVRIPMVEDRMPPDYGWRLSSATFKTLFMDHFSFPQLWRNCRNSKERAGFYTLCIFLPGFFFDQNPSSCSPFTYSDGEGSDHSWSCHCLPHQRDPDHQRAQVKEPPLSQTSIHPCFASGRWRSWSWSRPKPCATWSTRSLRECRIIQRPQRRRTPLQRWGLTLKSLLFT